MRIVKEDPRQADISALLIQHEADMLRLSPPESVHALDSDALCHADVLFVAAREGQELLGCGALLAMSPSQGEIKSMRTVARHKRKGVAAAILTFLVKEARHRQYQKLYLETGSHASFDPARSLYLRAGFSVCGPFGSYVDDPHSVFMGKELVPG